MPGSEDVESKAELVALLKAHDAASAVAMATAAASALPSNERTLRFPDAGERCSEQNANFQRRSIAHSCASQTWSWRSCLTWITRYSTLRSSLTRAGRRAISSPRWSRSTTTTCSCRSCRRRRPATAIPPSRSLPALMLPRLLRPLLRLRLRLRLTRLRLRRCLRLLLLRRNLSALLRVRRLCLQVAACRSPVALAAAECCRRRLVPRRRRLLLLPLV